jgi:CRP/FNR family transcriptional regulator
MGQECRYPSGTVLFDQGNRIESVYLVSAGVVRLTRRQNHRDVLVALRPPGWLLAGNGALVGREGQHISTATTASVCALRTMSSTSFRKLVEADRLVGQWVLQMFARETQEQLIRFAALLGAGGRSRVERVLVELFSAAHEKRPDGGLSLALGLTAQDLADIVSLTREQTSRILANLRDDGTVLRARGRFIVPAGSPLLPEVLASPAPL